MRCKGISTISVHSGEYIDEAVKAVVTPIFQSSTFLLSDKEYEKIMEGKERQINIYTRGGNPNRRAVEEKIMALEKGEDALTFSSGMAAVAASLLSILTKGDHLISTLDLYGGSSSLLKQDFPHLGIKSTLINSANLKEIEASIKPNTKLLFFESLSNPLLKILDLPNVVKIAKKHNLITIIDNTFLTPYNLCPLDYGIDLVVHSATKYLNGHSDIIAGLAVGRKSLIEEIWGKMVRFGASMDPHQAFLLERGLKTFSLRMQRHNENGKRIAEYLEIHPKINKVIYPGLKSYPQRELVSSLLKTGYSGMVSFEIKGGNETGLKFMKNLKIIREATSLGGVESLISMPFNTSHAGLTKEEKDRIGIKEGLIRLSCGIEDAEDLIEDIDQALSAVH
ncbi:cystathionine beta-lyase [Candidatus Aerophobetes bacterium]|uniref:Cystathionine beta-lyase n=1 Tax=Aerophobetes bacterium TaxID=2030807 RepID=A0A662D5I9_UNCAE|nr:MAG: cystathionine beta-lyase [Candidatus Aerophobetes bacterium]